MLHIICLFNSLTLKWNTHLHITEFHDVSEEVFFGTFYDKNIFNIMVCTTKIK